MKLFKGNIEPSCEYCENSRISANGETVFCKKKGAVEIHPNCKYFVYSPLKRIPKRMAPLKQYSKKDFML